VVGIDGPVGAGIPLVTIDDEGATADVVAHLAGLGHRQFGVVTLPSALDGDGAGVPRRRARAAREAIGLVPGATVRFVEATRNVVDEGERAAGALLDGAGSTSRPTALIAQSDVLALGCLRAAVLRGLDVPGRLSVAGFDGVDLHLPDGTALTTVTQPAQQKGQAAGRLLAVALDGGHPDDVRLAAVLRVGTTTGPPPADGT
jgi:DNA-binding LacI/PurR family transcriptional regulator